MVRSALITLGLLLAFAAPAAAQDQVQLLPPSLVSVVPIKHDGARAGLLTVTRDGDAITAVASFRGRPPGKTMSVCLTIAGAQRCATRKARRNGTVTLDTTAGFLTPLTAKARSGGARGHLTL